MSRPRSTDPSVALSIAVPQSLKTRLDQELSYKQSRSRWVTDAIKAKLLDMKAFDMSDVANQRLIAVFHARSCGCMAYESCTRYELIKSMMPVEEIEGLQ